MRRALLLLLCLISFSVGAAAQRRSAPKPKVTYLREGYYFQFTPCVRCYRCAPCALPDGWQREMMRAFKANRVNAFLAPPYQLLPVHVKHVRTVARIQSYNTSIFVGPYDSEEIAARDFKRICEFAAEVPAECRDWPEKEYSIGLANGVWAALDYVPKQTK